MWNRTCLKIARSVKTPWILSWLWVPAKAYCLRRLYVEKPNDIFQLNMFWTYIPDTFFRHRYTLASIVQYLPTWAETTFRTRVTVRSRWFEVATSLLTTTLRVFLPCSYTLVLCKAKMTAFLMQSLEFLKSVENFVCLMAIKHPSHLWKMEVGWKSLIDLNFTPFW